MQVRRADLDVEVLLPVELRRNIDSPLHDVHVDDAPLHHVRRLSSCCLREGRSELRAHRLCLVRSDTPAPLNEVILGHRVLHEVDGGVHPLDVTEHVPKYAVDTVE
jgi:hypothetical protein